jgi:hypothetical protein
MAGPRGVFVTEQAWDELARLSFDAVIQRQRLREQRREAARKSPAAVKDKRRKQASATFTHSKPTH